MKIRTRLRALTLAFLVLTSLCSVICASATDVSVYLIKKGLEYLQNDANAPTVNVTNGYAFQAEVDLTSNNSVTNAAVQPPAGLPGQVLALSSSQSKWDFKKKYNSLSALNTHYPNGSYIFTIDARNDGLRQPALQLLGDAYPNGPHLQNFAALQAVNPNGYLTVAWDAFPGGTAADFIQLRIEDPSGNKLFETPDIGLPGALNGTATRSLVAPGLLNIGQVNKATLLFQKTMAVDQISYPGASGQPAYYSRTTLSLITTRSNAPDVQTFEVFKGRKWIQTDANTLSPQAGSEFVFDASVQSYNTGALASGTVLLPPSNSPRALLLQSDGTTLDFTTAATTQSLLDSAYGTGNYTLSFNTAHDGNKSLILSLPADAFPPAPRITNFVALQNVNVAHPFTVSWDPWSRRRHRRLHPSASRRFQ